jgi:hypothetical protein
MQIRTTTMIQNYYSVKLIFINKIKLAATTVTNQNLIRETIKRRLNSGKACYYSIQNI